MNTTLKWVLGLLVVVAVVLGYKIVADNAGTGSAGPSAATQGAGGPVGAPQGGVPTKPVDRQAILATPGPDATEEERAEFFKLVVDSSVQTNTLNINSCVPEPVVASFRRGDNVILVNRDSGPHTIVFDEKTFYTVQASSTRTIKADFGKGAGIYGYGCDQSSTAVGIVLLTEEQ